MQNEPVPIRSRVELDPRPFRKEGLGYVMDFRQAGVRLTIDRIDDKSDELSGTVLARTYFPSTRHLLRLRVNLLTKTGKRNLASALQGLGLGRPDELHDDWAAAVESFSESVFESCNQGSPVKRVGDIVAETEPSYLIPRILLKGARNQIYGAGGTGKGHLACHLAVCVQYGVPFLGNSVEQANVLYLDAEDREGITAGRLQAHARGLGLKNADDILHRRQGPLVGDEHRLARIVDQYSVGLVIGDSIEKLIGAGGGHLTYEGRCGAAYQAMDEIGADATWLLIDHVSGDGQAGGAVVKPFGSVFKTNWVRNAWMLRHTQKPGDPINRIRMDQWKSNHGPAQAPIGLLFDFSNPGLVICRFDQPADLTPQAAPHNDNTYGARILAFLKSSPHKTVKNIHQCTGIPEASVRQCLNQQLKPKGLVTSETFQNDTYWSAVVEEQATDEPTEDLLPF